MGRSPAEEIGANLDDALAAAGVTQAELARRVHVSSAAVARWISPKPNQNASWLKLREVCLALGVSADRLLFGDEPDPRPTWAEVEKLSGLLREAAEVVDAAARRRELTRMVERGKNARREVAE